MGKVAAVGEVETHEAVVGLEERCVHCHVGRGARVGLHVDTPLLGVEAVGLEGASLAEPLHLPVYVCVRACDSSVD